MSEWREQLAAEAARLRAEGLIYRQIAERLGISRSYAEQLVNDPDGEKAEARRRRYGKCEDCGRPTDGSNGREKAPKVCLACYNARRAAGHGTRTKYQSGCSCDDCRRANTEYQRTLQGRPAPTHGYSGYTNYGCRCEVCTRAHTDYLWLRRTPSRNRVSA